MPELPEVETVRRTLEPSLIGRTVLGLEVGDYPTVISPHSPDQFSTLIAGRSVAALARRGKYLIVALDDGASVTIHLRMTGVLSVVGREEGHLRFERLRILLDDGRDLRFSDQRKFGRVRYRPPGDPGDLDVRLGPEPLSDGFTPEVLGQRLARRMTPIKALLLDQRIVAGVGNIYADEALFVARIHPRRPAGSLTIAEVADLVSAVRDVLRKAIDHRGTTFSSYRDADGNPGDNQRRLLVYGRGRRGEPCARCGAPLTVETVAQRSSHLCPSCQPMPLSHSVRAAG